MRYENSSGGMSAWEANIGTILNSISVANGKAADQVVVLPIEDVVSSKLDYERASTMLASDRDAMNSDLYHRIRSSHSSNFFSSASALDVSLPLVFNDMLDPSQTDDGLHFSDVTVRMQANILLNLVCNDRLPKVFPLDKTCCRRYPWPSLIHVVVLIAAILWGPVAWFLSRYKSK